MMSHSDYLQECLDWAKQFEERLNFIVQSVYGGAVQVRESLNGMHRAWYERILE